MKNSEKSAKTAVKKVFVFALLIAALSGAVYFNWQYTSKSGSITVSGAAKNTQKYLGDAKYGVCRERQNLVYNGYGGNLYMDSPDALLTACGL